MSNSEEYSSSNSIDKNEVNVIDKAEEDFKIKGNTSERCPRCGGNLIYDDYGPAWVIRCEKVNCLKVTFRGL